MHYHYYFSCNTYYKRDVPVDFPFHIPFFIICKGNINYCFWDFLGQKQPDGILNFSELSELSWSSENYWRKPLDYWFISHTFGIVLKRNVLWETFDQWEQQSAGHSGCHYILRLHQGELQQGTCPSRRAIGTDSDVWGRRKRSFQ